MILLKIFASENMQYVPKWLVFVDIAILLRTNNENFESTFHKRLETAQLLRNCCKTQMKYVSVKKSFKFLLPSNSWCKYAIFESIFENQLLQLFNSIFREKKGR